MYKTFKYNSAAIVSKSLGKRATELASFLPEIKDIGYLKLGAEANIGSGELSFKNVGKKLSDTIKKPYITFEDGFIASVGLQSEEWPLLSAIIDHRGAYYNATKASMLEEIILTKSVRKDSVERAKGIIKFIKENRITRYNTGLDIGDSAYSLPFGKSILLIDQFEDSKAITDKLEAYDDFHKMYNYACKKYPNHNFIIKSHPDAIKGNRRGFLQQYYRKLNVSLISEDINLHSIYDSVDAIFTVSSHSGFEALMAGKKVYVFGKPFYAGWGLTEDNKKVRRRKFRLKLEQLVAASLVEYPRYIDPYSKKLTTPENTLDLIVWLKQKYKRHSQYYHCIGFKKWQENYIEKSLSAPGNEVFFYNSANNAVVHASRSGGKVIVNTNSVKNNEEIKFLTKKRSVELLNLDDGFIRSIGFNSSFTASSSLVLDDLGVYYNGESESRLEKILENIKIDDLHKLRVQKLIGLLNEYAITKYNQKNPPLKLTFPRDKKLILVAGQIENDASIVRTKSKIRTNLRLLEYTRAKNQDSYIIYKPHPEVVSGRKLGHIPKKTAQKYCDFIMENVATSDLIKRCDEVYTISSIMGFEGLIRGKKVFTAGSPFYAGWGLTTDLVEFPRRTKKLTLEELVYGALILYPMYFDHDAGLPCRVEQLIQKIVTKYNAMKSSEQKSFNSLPFISKALTYLLD